MKKTERLGPSERERASESAWGQVSHVQRTKQTESAVPRSRHALLMQIYFGR